MKIEKKNRPTQLERFSTMPLPPSLQTFFVFYFFNALGTISSKMKSLF